MYIESIELEQTAEATGLTCTVEVRWTFGDQDVDLVEVYRGPLDNAEKLASVSIKGGKPTSTKVELPAGNPQVTVFVCPRLVDHTTLEDTMPDEAGTQRSWETFAVSRTIATRAAPGAGTVKRKVKLPPTITSVTTIPAALGVSLVLHPVSGLPFTKVPNRIRVFWLGDDFDEYTVRWMTNHPIQIGSNDKGVEVEPQDDDRSGLFVLHGAIPGLTYTFRVKGTDDPLIGSDTESDWSTPVSFVAQPNLTGLRAYLVHSGVDPRGGVRRWLAAEDAGRVRRFMQLA